MGTWIIGAGLAVLYNQASTVTLPIAKAVTSSEEMDALFVEGDLTDRVDNIVIQVDSWDLGLWHIDVVQGTPTTLTNAVATITVTGSPTGGSYEYLGLGIVINVGDNQAAVQAAYDTFSGGDIVVTGNWESHTIEFTGAYGNQPTYLDPGDQSILSGAGLTGGTSPAVDYDRTVIGDDGVADGPDLAPDSYYIAQALVPAGATSWNECTITDARTVASPEGLVNLADTNVVTEDGGGETLTVTQGIGSLDVTGGIEGHRLCRANSENRRAGILVAQGRASFGAGSAGEAGEPILLTFAGGLKNPGARWDNYGHDDASLPIVGNVYGTLAGDPFAGTIRVGTGGNSLAICDPFGQEVTDALAEGDSLIFGFTTGFYDD